jgi:hypothetical protein
MWRIGKGGREVYKRMENNKNKLRCNLSGVEEAYTIYE